MYTRDNMKNNKYLLLISPATDVLKFQCQTAAEQ